MRGPSSSCPPGLVTTTDNGELLTNLVGRAPDAPRDRSPMPWSVKELVESEDVSRMADGIGVALATSGPLIGI